MPWRPEERDCCGRRLVLDHLGVGQARAVIWSGRAFADSLSTCPAGIQQRGAGRSWSLLLLGTGLDNHQPPRGSDEQRAKELHLDGLRRRLFTGVGDEVLNDRGGVGLVRIEPGSRKRVAELDLRG
jgi:hypothetical protein